MSGVAPTCSISRAVHAARTLISLSPTFQAAVGADSADEALASVYYFEAVPELLGEVGGDEGCPGESVAPEKSMRPLAVIGDDPDARWYPYRSGCHEQPLLFSGSVFVTLSMDVDPEQSDSDSYLSFLNFFGGVSDDMGGREDPSNPGEWLAPPLFCSDLDTYGFKEIVLAMPVGRPVLDDRESDDYWLVDLIFSRGEGGI